MTVLRRAAAVAAALGLGALLGLGPVGAALAQDGAQPRAVPEGFVLPGPAPTGAAPEETAAPPEETAGARRPESLAIVPEAGTTDWPCVQRKVAEIAPASIWNGPDLAAADAAPRDAAMKALVESVASRRLPLREAEAAATDFARELPEGERAAKTAAVFVDLLARLNAERGRIIEGIERYGARQKQFAVALRERRAAFDALRAAGADRTAVQEARDALLLDQRLFDERRQSLTYVCEVPTLIEQRAFGLGRALGAALQG